MVIIYLIIVFINSMILYPVLDEFFSFSLWIRQYVYGGGEDLFSFVLIFILLGLALMPVYRVLEGIFFIGDINRSKKEILIYRIIAIVVSTIPTMFVFSIVSMIEMNEVLQYLLTVNCFVVIMLYLFSQRIQFESIVKGVFNYTTTRKYYIDTSVLIDGRFNIIVRYITGSVVVSEDVVEELHKLSDLSDDLIKRRKGQKGLENLTKLKNTKGIEVENIDLDKSITGGKIRDGSEKEDVDNRLIKYILKESKNGVLVTNDYNLTLVGEGKGITVLNLNKLNSELRMDIEEGDRISLIVSKKGNKKNQGVGTLEDGTLVLIDNAEDCVGKEVEVEVYNKLVKESGTMLFCRKVA